jgi:hypothetical protein
MGRVAASSGSIPEAVAEVSRANEHFVAGVDDGRWRDRHRSAEWGRYSRTVAVWRELVSRVSRRALICEAGIYGQEQSKSKA